jgi:hypothetical protein
MLTEICYSDLNMFGDGVTLKQKIKGGTMSEDCFKTCTSCGKEWETREDFLESPELEIVGYQVHFKKLEAGLLLFNHTCDTTLVLEAGDFKDLYDGEVFHNRATGGEECPGYCLHSSNLESCPAQCECGYVREIIKLIHDWPKK